MPADAPGVFDIVVRFYEKRFVADGLRSNLQSRRLDLDPYSLLGSGWVSIRESVSKRSELVLENYRLARSSSR